MPDYDEKGSISCPNLLASNSLCAFSSLAFQQTICKLPSPSVNPFLPTTRNDGYSRQSESHDYQDTGGMPFGVHAGHLRGNVSTWLHSKQPRAPRNHVHCRLNPSSAFLQLHCIEFASCQRQGVAAAGECANSRLQLQQQRPHALRCLESDNTPR